MRERPMIFSLPMVRAILDGRKTQLRRVMKPQPYVKPDGMLWWHWSKYSGSALNNPIGAPCPTWLEHCPFGQCGEKLWVRETWQCEPVCQVFYRADYHDDPLGPDLELSRDSISRKWRSPIHMPRWASRILLEVTDVRVERLQAISEEDSASEGVTEHAYPSIYGGWIACQTATLSGGYAALWESIHGPDSWYANPWIWVVSFRRIKQEARAA